MKRIIHITAKLMRFSVCVFFLAFAFVLKTFAQPSKTYDVTIKDGRERIELNRQISKGALDSLIAKYNLGELSLHQFLKTNFSDSLFKKGWKVEVNSQAVVVISKMLIGFNNITNPAEKIAFTEKHPTLSELFPTINNGVVYGYNRFRNKFPFEVRDSVVTFFLRNNKDAKLVILSGSFNKWSPYALRMTRTDSGWIARVVLGPGKYWYKFIVDGNWIVDNDNLLRENDGLGNTNSVFYKPNFTFTLNAFNNAKRIYLAGSFANWQENKLQMIKTNEGWKLPLYLAEGTYTYRYIVDGEWHTDPGNNDRFPNEFNDFNSVIRIGNSHLFKLDGFTNARRVILAGSFNDWREYELVMNKTSAGWEFPYTLGPGNYEYGFIVDGKWKADPQNLPVPNSGAKNSLLIIEPNYTFHLKGLDNARTIFLAGDFNNWNPGTLPMKREGNEWFCSIHLSTGKHLYKFIVDGKWIIDPYNKLWEQNEYDTGNSVMWFDK
ncbi:MAG TPA: hypothetical protein VKT28_14630 [Puia sp.]|nr:hypothetical protein [Puia sp.]